MSRRGSANSPYPHRGTPRGDEVVGPCEAIGCATILRRGDPFVTLVGDRLVCRPCHEKPDIMLREHRCMTSTPKHISPGTKDSIQPAEGLRAR